MKKMLFASFGFLLNYSAFASDNSFDSTPQPQTVSPPNSLISAARDGKIETVIELLTGESDQNMKDAALMQATLNGHIKIIKKLISVGANYNPQDENMSTAFLRNVQNGNDEIVQILLAADINVNVDTSVIKLGANTKRPIPTPHYIEPARGPMTALMIAAQNKNVEIIKLLLAAGADPRAKDSGGKTAHDYANEETPEERASKMFIKIMLHKEMASNIPEQNLEKGKFLEQEIEKKRNEIITLLDTAVEDLNE